MVSNPSESAAMSVYVASRRSGLVGRWVATVGISYTAPRPLTSEKKEKKRILNILCHLRRCSELDAALTGLLTMERIDVTPRQTSVVLEECWPQKPYVFFFFFNDDKFFSSVSIIIIVVVLSFKEKNVRLVDRGRLVLSLFTSMFYFFFFFPLDLIMGPIPERMDSLSVVFERRFSLPHLLHACLHLETASLQLASCSTHC